MVSGHCTTLREHVVSMRKSYFDIDFSSQMKSIKFPLIHWFVNTENPPFLIQLIHLVIIELFDITNFTWGKNNRLRTQSAVLHRLRTIYCVCCVRINTVSSKRTRWAVIVSRFNFEETHAALDTIYGSFSICDSLIPSRTIHYKKE